MALKILFISRATLFNQPGGDTVQVEQTAAYLEKLGHQVHIQTGAKPNRKGPFDIVHFFNLIRPADARYWLLRKVPFIISSIYHDYSEFDQKQRKGLAHLLFSLFGKMGVEYFKTIARWLNKTDQFPGIRYLVKGQKRSMQELLVKAQALVTTSQQEINLIKNDLGYVPHCHIIPLGSEHMTPPIDALEKQGVFCAARIEGAKNQLQLIHAVQSTSLTLRLSGNAATNQSEYYERCKTAASKSVTFLGRIDKVALQNEFAKAKTHALISYYETTGLSTLEALANGCQVVITNRGAQPEIFGEHAFYCDPENINTIKEALLKANESNISHQNWVKENFSWVKATHKISDIYKQLLNEPNK